MGVPAVNTLLPQPLSKTDSSKLENGKALVWSQPLILPPRHERLGVREHTQPASTKPRRSRVPRVGSTSRALLEHRWYIGGMKLPSFLLELASLYFGSLTRETRLRRGRRVCSFAVSRHQPGMCRPHPSSADRTSSPKAIPEHCQGASIADHLFNQR